MSEEHLDRGEIQPIEEDRRRTYGREWRTSDTDALPEILSYLSEKITADGGRIIMEIIIKADEDRHWRLDCEDVKPHAHIFFKWVSK